MKNILLTTFLGSIVAGLSNTAIASDFGCEALLCFAGGKNVAECQPTIRKVLRDLSKGRSFPHCSLVSSPNTSGNNSSINNSINVRHYNSYRRSPICQDGETRGKRTFVGYSCPTIEINISPDIASDINHQKQIYNYNFN